MYFEESWNINIGRLVEVFWVFVDFGCLCIEDFVLVVE